MFAPVSSISGPSYETWQVPGPEIKSKALKAVHQNFVQALSQSRIPQADKNTVCMCLDFATEKHQFQARKDAEKTPYIIHPIGVALSILVEAQVEDPELMMIALLHDTIEDTGTTYVELLNKFGPRIADPVQELSDEVDTSGVKTQDQATRKQLQIEHAGHMTYAATIVKLSDKLYNLRDLVDHVPTNWSNDRVLKYADFGESVLNNIKAHHQDKLTDGMMKLEQLVEEQIKTVREKYQ